MMILRAALLGAGTLAGLSPALTPAPVQAGAINSACRQSNSTTATPARCKCIDKIASASLTRSERITVAKWFADPHQAQVVRQSDIRSDEQLWLRYKAFGKRAARSCS